MGKHGINVNAKLIAEYTNGNYNVELYDDGTKIRFADVDEFVADFPENIDVCITKRCDGGCPWCYEGCTVDGQHGYIGQFINDEFVLPGWMLSLKPGTELAINGNDLSHPVLEDCLKELRNRGIIVNMTINQMHLAPNYGKLLDWQHRELIHGIGISLMNSEDDNLYTMIKGLKNVVIHIIAGIFTMKDLCNLQSGRPKILILGYKNLGRGVDYSLVNTRRLDSNIEMLKMNLPSMVATGLFDTIAFDNLAIEQLDVKKNLFNNNEEKWSRFYMGDDGSFTMYIDTVACKYAKNSCMPNEERFDLGDDAGFMFRRIKEIYKK